MKDAQKPDHVSLNTLVSYLRDGRFVIPDFQREFEWKPWDIRELMRSIFLDHAKKLPAPRQLDARRKLRHWYWASVFNNRHSGSVESTSSRDFLDVKAWFEDDTAEPPLIAEFAQRFRNLDLRKEIKRGTSVYNGIFNLLVLQRGARLDDW